MFIKCWGTLAKDEWMHVRVHENKDWRYLLKWPFNWGFHYAKLNLH